MLTDHTRNAQIHDIFVDKPLSSFENQQFDVTYVYRYYGILQEGTTPTGDLWNWWHHLIAYSPENYYNDGKYSTMLESRQTVTYDTGIVTSVGTVRQAAMPLDTNYYDATGHCSAVPHAGFNIAITRYSDGSATAGKVFR